MRMLATIGAAVTALVFNVVAFAADLSPLTTADIQKFIATAPEAEALFNDLEDNGFNPDWEGQMMPKSGEDFRPFGKTTELLKTERPSDYASLTGIVKPKGFDDTPHWARIGDASILAYIAIKMEREDPQALAMASQLTPEMMAMIPPAQQAQLQGAMAIIEAIQGVPAADKAAMEPVYEDFENAFEGFDSSN